MSKLYYGFLDESGILEKKSQEGKYFVVSIVLVGNPSELQRVMKRARQKARGKFKIHSVFKANKESKGFVRLVLEELAKGNVGIVAEIWDKNRDNFKGDKNKLYARLLAKTTAEALAIYPKLDLVLHKRYTSPRVRELVTSEMSAVADKGDFLSVSHRSEVECRQLELADAVAWSVFQKYNNKDESFYRLIKDLIKKENRITA